MSDINEKDLEDEIPANRINTMEAEDIIGDEEAFAESNNFIEILVEDELEEGVVEYVDYSEDDNIEQDKSPVIEQESNVTTEVLSENSIKKELNGEDSDMDHEEKNIELYHCSSCDTNFHSVMDHINEFHKNQSVVLDGVDKDCETRLEATDASTKPEDNFIIPGDLPMEYAYLEENTKDKKLEMISEEKCFDANGRPYLRKKVRIFDVGLVNSVEHKCESCEKIFLSLEDCNKHTCEGGAINSENPTKEINSKDKPPYTYPCPHCGNVFLSHRSLASHLRVHKTSRKETAINPPEETEARCHICNTTFPSMKSLKLHRRMHDPIKMKPIEEAVGYEIKSHSRDGVPKETFFCEICNKSYDKVYQEIHKKAHKSGPTLICTVCNKKFPSKINLTMHMNVHQEQYKRKGMTKAEISGITLPYECTFCGRQFGRPHEKVKHERIHTGEKPYKCEICGKCFRVSYCLTLHLRTHTGARPYVCPHCNKRFKAYSVYNHHLMTHSENRPYKCPYCPKAFKTSVQLGGHKNSHTKPFSCPDCNRPFASLYAVKAHMETHKKGSQNLKHRCGICGAIYARIFALRDHMKEQHQSSLDDGEAADVIIAEVKMENENIMSAQSIIPDNEEEITVGEMEHFQTEEVVTDWLK